MTLKTLVLWLVQLNDGLRHEPVKARKVAMKKECLGSKWTETALGGKSIGQLIDICFLARVLTHDIEAWHSWCTFQLTYRWKFFQFVVFASPLLPAENFTVCIVLTWSTKTKCPEVLALMSQVRPLPCLLHSILLRISFLFVYPRDDPSAPPVDLKPALVGQPAAVCQSGAQSPTGYFFSVGSTGIGEI